MVCPRPCCRAHRRWRCRAALRPAEQVAEASGELRTGIERQEASELAGDVADSLPEALVAERTAGGARPGWSRLSNTFTCGQIGPASNGRRPSWPATLPMVCPRPWLLVRTPICRRAALRPGRADYLKKRLRGNCGLASNGSVQRPDVADGLPEALAAERTADGAERRLTGPADCRRSFAGKLRGANCTGIERQEASELAGDVAGLPEAQVAERNRRWRRRARLTVEQIAEALRQIAEGKLCRHRTAGSYLSGGDVADGPPEPGCRAHADGAADPTWLSRLPKRL